MLEKLKELFIDHFVRITSTDRVIPPVEGVCTNIIDCPELLDHFLMEIDGEFMYSFNPEVVDSDSVEGDVKLVGAGRVKVEIIVPGEGVCLHPRP